MARPTIIRISIVGPSMLLLGLTPLSAQAPRGKGASGTPAATATAAPSITVQRVAEPPRLEDFLGAHSPAATVISDFRQRDPGDGVPVSEPTAAYLSYDEANLYVVFVCRDNPAKVRAGIARREDIGDDDQVVVYLDTFRDRKRAYFFMVNPRGVQLDGVMTEGQDDDLSFDAVWHSEGRLTPDGYVVRVAIPFRSLRFARTPEQTWGIALGRMIRRNSEESYWPLITKRVQGFVPQFAAMSGLADISPGRNLQLNPYTAAARARVLDQDAVAFLRQSDERIGIDAKAVLRDALTLDATANPDFSQVETDDPQVTVNQRFEVFFPEKRPFFIENAGYFQTPVNLFFSRRLIDPGAGLRLTGKAGRWALGAIAMNDRAPVERQDEPDLLAGRRAGVEALRLQRELGEESTIGVLVTDRQLRSSFNRIFSLDSRLKLGKNWAFSGQVIRSDTRLLQDTARASRFGAVAQLERDGRHVDYTGRYIQFDPGFAAPLGFVERVGIRQMEQKAQYKWRPKKGPLLAYGPTLSVLYTWDPHGGMLDREIAPELLFELRGETQIKIKRIEAFELFEGFGFRPYDTKASFETRWLTWLGIDASYKWGTAVNHDPADGLNPFLTHAVEAEVQATLRLTPRLRLEQQYVEGALHTRDGQRVASERQWRSKVNYQFNRALSLRAIVDYHADDADTTLFDEDARQRKWNLDFLFTYLVNPGTALYVGYADKYENLGLDPGPPPSVGFRRSPRMSTGRQLFVKLSYLFRF